MPIQGKYELIFFACGKKRAKAELCQCRQINHPLNHSFKREHAKVFAAPCGKGPEHEISDVDVDPNGHPHIVGGLGADRRWVSPLRGVVVLSVVGPCILGAFVQGAVLIYPQPATHHLAVGGGGWSGS